MGEDFLKDIWLGFYLSFAQLIQKIFDQRRYLKFGSLAVKNL